MAHIPKAVLYYYPRSIWVAAVRLALEEKGYGEDEIDLKIVDLSQGENYEPTFLRLNPKATVPTLLVPYENSLTDGVESRYKALTETKAIIEFLDKSRSPRSRTHTTSAAPAPTLTPATIAASNIAGVIIDDILHSAAADPNALRSLNARDDAGLKTLADQLLPSFRSKKAVLDRLLQGEVRASEKTRQLWTDKQTALAGIIDVLEQGHKDTSELDEQAKDARAAFFKKAKLTWEVNLASALLQLSKEMIGPYALGDQFSVADLHLAAWLARVAALSGATALDDGKTVVSKIETHVGMHLPRDFVGTKFETEKQSVIGAFWDAVKERAGWKKVYGEGVF